MTLSPQAQRLRPFKPTPYGRYTLLLPLSAGGMGEIFLARLEGAQGFEKPCVIKRILPHLAQDPDFVGRFINEAKTLVTLSHGSVAQVLDMGIHEGLPYLAMEFIDGKDLRRVAARMHDRSLPLPLTFVLYTMSRVLDALGYAHRKRDDNDRELGLVHRDVSPQNIIVSYEGDVKVIDFGLVKSTLNVSSTHPSIVMGKFMYMSPEQALHQRVDKRSDLYAVGMCLYELIAGKNPFETTPPSQLMDEVASPKIPHLRDVEPLCPPACADIVMKALAVDPKQRFQTAEEFRARLTASLLEIDPLAGPESASRFMREAFAADYLQERKLLHAQVEAAAQIPKGGTADTGRFSTFSSGPMLHAPGAEAETSPRVELTSTPQPGSVGTPLDFGDLSTRPSQRSPVMAQPSQVSTRVTRPETAVVEEPEPHEATQPNYQVAAMIPQRLAAAPGALTTPTTAATQPHDRLSDSQVLPAMKLHESSVSRTDQIRTDPEQAAVRMSWAIWLIPLITAVIVGGFIAWNELSASQAPHEPEAPPVIEAPQVAPAVEAVAPVEPPPAPPSEAPPVATEESFAVSPKPAPPSVAKPVRPPPPPPKPARAAAVKKAPKVCTGCEACLKGVLKVYDQVLSEGVFDEFKPRVIEMKARAARMRTDGDESSQVRFVEECYGLQNQMRKALPQ